MNTPQTLHILTREEILAVPTAKADPVEVPGWGGFVWVKGLSGKERDSFELSMIQTRGKNRVANLDNMRARLLSRCIVDAEVDGKRLFQPDDIGPLGDKSGEDLQRCYIVAQQKSGLSPADVEELTVELGEGQNSDSGTS